MENLTEILVNTLSPDPNIRLYAEKWLREAEQQNLAMFVHVLCAELANNDKPQESRRAAGQLLKNTFTAREEERRLQLIQKWVTLDVTVRNQIKAMILSTLGAPQKDVRHTATLVVSTIAQIEIPRGLWPEVIQILLNNMNALDNESLRHGTLEAIGYVCEQTDPEIMKTQSNEILTAVCKGILDNNNEIKLVALTALSNALEFVKENFGREKDRNYIMQVVCDSAICPDPKVRVVALECLVKIGTHYYDKLAPYMQRIFNITLEAIDKDIEEVALQGIEFWSTVCDEETDIADETEEASELGIPPTRTSQNFIKGALKYLIPIITRCLTKQEDEPDEDTWNVAMAAGTCLSLIATTAGDEVIPHVMPFVQENINNSEWKNREAATLAFGSVLEGPKSFISQLISQAIPVLLNHMKDPVPYVKDTTAWTLGRICRLHPSTIGAYLPQLIQILAESLSDSPRVASNVCWAIHNLAEAYEDDQDKQTSALSPFFQPVLEKLMQTTERDDSDMNNLRTSAYEAINVLIQAGAKDTHNVIYTVLPLFIARLEKTFTMEIVEVEDREQQNELQSLLCGVLQVITSKLGSAIKNWADKMMDLYLKVFSAKSASVHEEALMAVGAVATAVEGDFDRYMTHFKPFLLLGLRNVDEYQVCAVAVGVVGDVSRALLTKLTPHCDELIGVLLQALQSGSLSKGVKPHILSLFGDISLAIGGEFIKYLPVVMTMLQQACGTNVDMNDYDMVEYLNLLREGIFEAYTGILQGLRSDKVADPHFIPYVQHVVNFVAHVYSDHSRTEAVTRGAVGVLGDIAHALGPKAKEYLQQPFVTKILIECSQSDNSSTRDVAKWAKDVIHKL